MREMEGETGERASRGVEGGSLGDEFKISPHVIVSVLFVVAPPAARGR